MVKIEDVNEMDEVEIVNYYKDFVIKLLVSKKEVVF